MATMEDTKNVKEIEDIIARAIKKVGAKKENELRRYLPMSSGGHMHHFTLKKMRSKQPEEFLSLLKKFIVNNEHPTLVPPKQRAPRGSKKKKDQYTFTHSQIERMRTIALQAGDNEMASLLSPKKTLPAWKRELIQSIRDGKADQEMWNGYMKALETQHAIVQYAQQNATTIQE